MRSIALAVLAIVLCADASAQSTDELGRTEARNAGRSFYFECLFGCMDMKNGVGMSCIDGLKLFGSGCT